MEIYFRAKDMKDELKSYQTIIAEMAKDMIELFGDDTYTAKDLISAYIKWYNAPTAFESILIKKGTYTKEEAKRNLILEHMKKLKENK